MLFAASAGVNVVMAAPVVEFVKVSCGFVASTRMQLEPLPKPSAEFPVATSPSSATVMFELVAFTTLTEPNRTRKREHRSVNRQIGAPRSR